ncbi:unnamed protein product [Didymodactylos carnosus]|uniref:UNC93-like protein MFSD11 n=1 Tax=Didymodactylos carnosus TaxID=1234261 RepID=A0A814EXG8_9BILA|nr:unnamed protein product [Didymodactylos carnosus]CAF0973195.1 unnamed protein product [Didymodactylos carnosus]CAF3569854.1 unnamed protein product [Didymodactylos carnosus]CAF3746108.1 unnamed protein product [Didymodactylos carnosus]
MFIGATTYFLYVLSFIKPMIWSFYLVSILVGIGAAIIWTAQGAFLAVNSDELSISRNSGVFWALFQVSLLAGNLYVYVSVRSDIITRKTRYLLFTVFSVVSGVGLALFLFIIWRSFIEKRRQKNLTLLTGEKKKNFRDILQELIIALRLLRTRNMLLLLLPFAYSGEDSIG